MAKFKMHEVRISFDAPPLKELNPESLTIEGEEKFEANFQWKKYLILFTDKDMTWYSYVTPLYPWGTKKDGGEEISMTDSLGRARKDTELTPEEVEDDFGEVLSKINLKPKEKTVYINAHAHDKGKSYSSDGFRTDFIDSGRYIMLTKDRKLVGPFGGKPVGGLGKPKVEPVKPAIKPTEEMKMASDIYRRAVRNAAESDYFTGGFDIMKKFQKKQKGRKIRKKQSQRI